MKRIIRRDQQNGYVETCATMRTVMNIARNWLGVVAPQAVDEMPLERGCMRSVRLARLTPVDHRLTSRSVLQMVVLPAAFDFNTYQGFDHPRWHIIVYSWMDLALTRQLMAELRRKVDTANLKFVIIADEMGVFDTLS